MKLVKMTSHVDSMWTVESSREYREIAVVVSARMDEECYGGLDVEVEYQYLDPKTGIVVHDVFAYEKWLEGVGE